MGRIKIRKYRPYRIILRLSLNKGTDPGMYKDIEKILKSAGIMRIKGKTGTYESERTELGFAGQQLSDVMTLLADFDTGYLDHVWMYIDRAAKQKPKEKE